MHQVSVVILSAGFGTRMKSNMPKVLHKICGKEMLFCIIDEASKLSDDLYIVLYNEANLIKDKIDSAYPNHNIKFHIQNHDEFPGTAGALMKGYGNEKKSPIDTKYSKILILSADMPLIQCDTLRHFIRDDCDIAIGVLELQDASGYGRVILENNRVAGIVEEKDATDDVKRINFANAGAYCFKREILDKYIPKLESNNRQNEYYLTDVINLANNDHYKIIGVNAKENEFIGVNSKVDLARAESFMLDLLRNKAMRDGVIFRIPNSIYIEFGVEFIGECEIESNCVLKRGSKIIESKILSNSVIEDSVIEHSIIGPFARIRPKSYIKDSRVGNFVEIKESVLNHVKAGHLSYLGDSSIDSGTNIGAGVITCNYDGINKHKTIIGKNVFIGSDTQLIAPLKIESNVLIAAGSCVNKDAKDGDLVISRPKQINQSGFYYQFFKDKK